jgi:type III pantothenate kinase
VKPVLLLNIGNTHVQVALATGARIEIVQTLETGDVLSPDAARDCLDPYPDVPCLAACVVPAARAALEQAHPERELRFLAAGLIRELNLALVDASTVGADRLANAIAASAIYAPPVIVLDCGTAITTEVVDGDRQFRGGAILPGRQLLRRALNRHTGQLPEIPLQDQCPPAIGTTTAAAIRAGVDLGVLGSVDRLLAETRAEMSVDACPVIAVGGDAPYFVNHLSGLTAGPADFTLRGLLPVARRLFALRT